METWLIVLLVVVLLGGGGWGFSLVGVGSGPTWPTGPAPARKPEAEAVSLLTFLTLASIWGCGADAIARGDRRIRR
jgi:hypothetical protein